MSDIDEDPDAPDSLWMTATGASPSVRVSFATPSYAISGTQTFKARVRRQSGGSGTRTARIDLYEAGTLKATGSAQTITSTSGQTITQTFDFDSLTLIDPSGGEIEARLVGATTSGSKSIDLGALRWTASYVLSRRRSRASSTRSTRSATRPRWCAPALSPPRTPSPTTRATG